jgi:hypothetical protein
VVIASLVLLTSCGGGGGATAPVANTPTPSANTQVINGISVPPEPDPVVNNATLAGVDSNNNGVRDDVERKIAEKSVNINNNELAITISKAYSKIIETSGISPAETTATMKYIRCNILQINPTLDIYNLLANSTLRSDIFLENIQKAREASGKASLSSEEMCLE